MECLMQDLVKRASELAARLKAGNHTVAVAESSTGGMLSAALLAVPGASAYFIGGAVVYTRASRRVLLGISDEAMAGMRPSTEAYALLVARTARERFATTWALGETGAAGPTGWRCLRPQLHRRRRSGRARDHARNGQRRPLRQHDGLHRGGARSADAGDGGGALIRYSVALVSPLRFLSHCHCPA
jgi:PncC family amidohydrolase